MRRNVAGKCVFIILAALLLTGCTSGTTEDDTMGEEGPVTKEKSELSFKSIDADEAPESVQNWVDKNREKEAKKVFYADGKTYVLILLGQKSTGGYAVEIDAMQLEKIVAPESKAGKGTVNVTYHTIEPEEGSINIQALTYPMAIAELEGTRDYDYRFVEKNNDDEEKDSDDAKEPEVIRPEEIPRE